LTYQVLGAEVVGGADYSIAQIIRSRRLFDRTDYLIAQIIEGRRRLGGAAL